MCRSTWRWQKARPRFSPYGAGANRTRREPVHGMANILLRSFDITDSLKYEQDAHRYDGVCEMIMVTPCFDFDVGFLDFRHSGKLIDMAYEATIQARTEFTHLIGNRKHELRPICSP